MHEFYEDDELAAAIESIASRDPDGLTGRGITVTATAAVEVSGNVIERSGESGIRVQR